MPLRAPGPGVASRRAVLLAGAAVVLLRLPYLVAPTGNDEGGYLAVAHQWHGSGSSLYGQYWVDRPPLLITLFQLADVAGGLPALRVIGALSAGLATLGVAASAALMGGSRAAMWSAAVAGALFVSPQLGTVQVNGELLSAPFVAWSVAAWLYAAGTHRRRLTAAAAAGALAVAALLVKQNMAEPLVFGAVLLAGRWRTGSLSGRALGRLLLAAASGAVAVALVVGAWTVAHGTSPVGVLDAMYGFRLRAADVLATTVDAGQVQRSHALAQSLLTSGLVLVPLALAWSAARRLVGGPAVRALLATLAWSAVSMLLGGGFWDHYQVELVVPVGLAAGVLAGRVPTGRWAGGVPRLAAILVVAVALGHWLVGQGPRVPEGGESLGRAIAATARPGDTLVSAVGDAQSVEASGLRSPYPYLWTLPVQVDDPRLDRLVGLLRGPDAPTWLLTWSRPTFPAAARDRLAAAVAARYRPVAVLCGHDVYLRDGVVRAALRPIEACVAPTSVVPRVLHEVDPDAHRG